MNECSCTGEVKSVLVKLPRWLERWVQGALTGYVREGSGSVVHDEVGITCIGHPPAPYPSLSSGPSHSIDLGDLLASPRWRFRRWDPPNPSWEGGGYSSGCGDKNSDLAGEKSTVAAGA